METHRSKDKFTQSSFSFILSKTLERAGYYGLRAVVVLYMIGETLEMSQEEALTVYGTFTAVLVLTQLIGAVFGDLLIGNKNAAVVGGFLQAMGAFVLCIPNTIGFYTGLILVAIGTGLYAPNVFSLVGKIYKPKEKSLDAGFTLFYTAINTGAFLGVLLIGLIAEIKYTYGFICAGILFLLGTGLLFLGENRKDQPETPIKPSISRRIIIVLVAVIVTSVFWTCFQLGSYQVFFALQNMIDQLNSNMSASDFSSVSSLGTIFFGIIAGIAWFFLQFSRFLKIAIGFFLGGLSFMLLVMIPSLGGTAGIIIYVISMALMSLAEILVAPIAHSLLVRYAKTKFLALLFVALIAPTYLFNYLTGLFSDLWYDSPNLGPILGIILFVLAGIGILIAKFALKENLSKQFEA